MVGANGVEQTGETTLPSFEWVFKGRSGLVIGILIVCFWLRTLTSVIDNSLETGIFPPVALGSIGLTSDVLVNPHGWQRISTIDSDGASHRAGLAPDMLVRFDHPYEGDANLTVGRTVGVTVAQNARIGPTNTRHLSLAAQRKSLSRYSPRKLFGLITYLMAGWFTLMLGTFALVRSRGSITALVFGLAMMAYSADFSIPSWAIRPDIAGGYLMIDIVTRFASLGLALLPAAAYAERIGRIKPAWIALFASLVLVGFARDAIVVWCLMQGVSAPIVGTSDPVSIPLYVSALMVGLYWAWRGRNEAAATDRARFTALLAATCGLVITSVLTLALPPLADRLDATSGLIVSMVPPLAFNILLPLIAAYVVLRHKVVDLGFALNRTVVYTTVSAVLLGSFGLIEWGIEHLLPEEWVKASAWIDAGAAVLVYLAFHRVHDAVEHRVEHLFFHQWQANEDALRRFVGSAAHFEDTRALARAFADELARFGGEANVALYRRNEGALDRVAGNWDAAPRHFRDDDPAFALLRAEREPLDLTETRSNLPGVLALPMLDHGALAGLVLLDLKGNGLLWRPDEVALLGWAAHEVGLALAARQAGLIETENRLLKAQLTRLGTIIGDRLEHTGA